MACLKQNMARSVFKLARSDRAAASDRANVTFELTCSAPSSKPSELASAVTGEAACPCARHSSIVRSTSSLPPSPAAPAAAALDQPAGKSARVKLIFSARA